MRTSVWAIGLLVVLSGTAAAQSARAKVDMNAPAPRLPNGRPDFSGVWARPGVQDMTRTVKNANGTSNVGEPNPLSAEQREHRVPLRAEHHVPGGQHRGTVPSQGLAAKLVGDSRGHWDGDSLVIEAVQFKWVLEDATTYTRPIGNERVFVLTPDVELMEYSCMEGNLQALIDGGITPWLGAKDSDDNKVYDAQHQWSAYELGAAQKLSGVLKQIKFNETMPTMTLDVAGKPVLVVLAPAPRMEFRDLTEDMLKPGMTVGVTVYRSKARPGEFRAESITVAKRIFDLR